jgi:hypothetical protein
MHDVIVRLLRVHSKGCSSQRSEFCCGKFPEKLVGASSCSLFLQPLPKSLVCNRFYGNFEISSTMV